MQSTLFLQNITQIDYAVINTKIWAPEGRSVHLNVKVTGEVDKHEQVVVDFSTLKSSLKKLIDDRTKGFDHKLWVPLDLVSQNKGVEIYDEDGETQLITPHFETIVPYNAIRYVDDHDICGFIVSFLDDELQRLYPRVKIRTNVWLDYGAWIPSQMRDHAHYFSYVHGLKNSSSWGCQNINHGHNSWVAVVDKDNNGIHFDWSPISRVIDNAVFVWDENIASVEEGYTTIRYTTERGYFESSYGPATNVVKVKTETTVENLAAWFIEMFEPILTSYDMKQKGACGLWISEGLAKGAFQAF